jgi:hypothetical protein
MDAIIRSPHDEAAQQRPGAGDEEPLDHTHTGVFDALRWLESVPAAMPRDGHPKSASCEAVGRAGVRKSAAAGSGAADDTDDRA